MAQRLIIKALSLRYSASEPKALSSLSMEVEAGSCCAVIGPTGAGKSTLLHCLAGTMGKHHPEAVASGHILIGDAGFNGIPRQILFPVAALVLQDPCVQISGVRDTVSDEILFTLENLGTIPNNPRNTILSLLQRLGIEHLAARKPTSLSGGETQRVALAAILIAQPPVLLLDEPTTALDSKAQDKLRFILRSLQGRTTILLSDTQIDFAVTVADQIILLDHGRVIFRGDQKALFSQLHKFSAILPVDGWIPAQSYLSSPAKSSGHRQLVAKVLGLE